MIQTKENQQIVSATIRNTPIHGKRSDWEVACSNLKTKETKQLCSCVRFCSVCGLVDGLVYMCHLLISLPESSRGENNKALDCTSTAEEEGIVVLLRTN